MTISYQHARDTWKYLPGIEEITYTPLNGDAVTGVKAKRMTIPAKAKLAGIFSGGLGIDVGLAVFLLWDEFLGGLKPEDGGTITQASGDLWIVGKAEPEKFGSEWRCICSLEKK